MSEQNDSFQAMCLRVVFVPDILHDYERLREQTKSVLQPATWNKPQNPF